MPTPNIDQAAAPDPPALAGGARNPGATPQNTPTPLIALVVNQDSGAMLGRADLAAALRTALHLASPGLIEPGGEDLTARLRAACDSGAGIVVVAGGDGTLACAAAMLEGTSVPLGIIPAGTANLLARDLGIPLTSLEDSARIAVLGQRRQIDVGWAGGHAFLCAAMFGSPARLGHHRETGRRRGNGLLGWLHFLRALLRAARRHRAVTYRVTVDGICHRLRTPTLTVTLNALDEPGGRMFGRACLNGGSLHTYAVRHRSAFGWIRLAFNILRRRFKHDPAVTELRGTNIAVNAPGGSLRVLLDGEERVLPTPVMLTLHRNALTIMAPP